MHFGGYTIIRFEVTNPASYIGWWFIHCHIKIHQLNGMAAVARELPADLPKSSTELPTIILVCYPYHAPCSILQLRSSSLVITSPCTCIFLA